MSFFSGLFGTGSDGQEKIEKSVGELFGKSNAVSREQLKSQRTVVETEEKDESGEMDVDSENESENESESESESVTKVPVRKNKSDDLEAAYFSKLLQEDDKELKQKKKAENNENGGSDSGSDSDSDSEAEASAITKGKKAKVVDLKENELSKANKTVFVGNLSNSVISSKSTYKQFKALFSQYGKVASIRFRSIAFDEALPRKIAFVQKKFHKLRETINAYVVFAEDEAARKSVAGLNATVFDNHHLRVDSVGHPSAKDNKRTIFVGNLDFEEQEETLWKYFNDKCDNDVESVRIVRDSATNLGKGFALVQFKDTLSVTKALLLNDKSISKEKKRKLRISRAKAHTKPSILSPNHIDNKKKKFAADKARKLNDKQKSKLGKAIAVLGKADRASAGKMKVVMEGERATKGSSIAGIKGKKGKVKKPRIRDRSTKFKLARDSNK